MVELSQERERMLREHLIGRGIHDPAVLKAMETVPREEFVEAALREYAYEDHPLPIDESQTISQPYIVAYMAEALAPSPEHKILEIGTGSGYSAAVLSRIVREVYTVEHFTSLAWSAVQRFKRLRYDNIHVLEADGTLGWPEYAPYDGIIVTAAAPHIPKPLVTQLSIGGRMVIPVAATIDYQMLIRLERISEKEFTHEELCAVRFVPLIGQAGWKEP